MRRLGKKGYQLVARYLGATERECFRDLSVAMDAMEAIVREHSGEDRLLCDIFDMDGGGRVVAHHYHHGMAKSTWKEGE